MRRAFVTAACLAACSGTPEDAPIANTSPLRAVLPAAIDAQKPHVIEDSTGVIAMYAREPMSPSSATNPLTQISILAPSPNLREQGLVAGWYKPRPNDSTIDVVAREYRGRKAQVARSRHDCGDTMLGKPIDPTRCSLDIELAVRLSNERVLIVRKSFAAGDRDVLAIADTLDLSAIDAAAGTLVVSRD